MAVPAEKEPAMGIRAGLRTAQVEASGSLVVAISRIRLSRLT